MEEIDIRKYCNIKSEYAKEIVKKEYERDRFSDKLDWVSLSANEFMIDILEKEFYLENNRIDERALCYNKKAGKLILDYVYTERTRKGHCYYEQRRKHHHIWGISWTDICANPSCIEVILDEYKYHPESHKHNLCWNELCRNKNILPLIRMELEKNPDSENIHWQNLCENKGSIDLIREILEKDPESKKICWVSLSCNKNACDLLLKYPEKVFWWCVDYEEILTQAFLLYPDNEELIIINETKHF